MGEITRDNIKWTFGEFTQFIREVYGMPSIVEKLENWSRSYRSHFTTFGFLVLQNHIFRFRRLNWRDLYIHISAIHNDAFKCNSWTNWNQVRDFISNRIFKMLNANVIPLMWIALDITKSSRSVRSYKNTTCHYPITWI
jgi:hypothetical protein